MEMSSLQATNGGIISPVVESTAAVTRMTTTTTATTVKIITNGKACAGPSTAEITAIHTPAAATMGGLNPNLTMERDRISSSSIMTNKRQLAEQEQQLHTMENNSQAATTDPSAGADSTQSNTRPGAVCVDGPHHHDSESSSSESSSLEEMTLSPLTHMGAATQSSLSSIHILHAELVDEAELQQRAQAEFQRMMEQAAVAQATLVDDEELQVVNTKPQRTWIIACSILVVVAVIVTVTGVLLGMGGGANMTKVAADVEADQSMKDEGPFINATNMTDIPADSDDIDGIEEWEYFGWRVGFSADGNTIAASAIVFDEAGGDFLVGQVRAYSYQEESGEWKQLGQYITGETATDEYDLNLALSSPKGKYLAIATSPVSGAGFIRIFALRKDNATDDPPAVWEQIGSDLYNSQNTSEFGCSVSLMDSLVLAVADCSNLTSSVYIYQFDTIQADWVPMGQTIQVMVDDEQYGYSLQLAMNSMGTVILAVGGTDRVRLYHYVKDVDSWGKVKSGDSFGGGALVDLSRDGSTLAVGVWHNASDGFDGRIEMIHVFSLDAETYDWTQLGKDIQDPLLTFGEGSLSANGTVLATTTMPSGLNGSKFYVTGEVRIWDFTVNSSSCHGEGEWIQRGLPLTGSHSSSYFGIQVALSSDGGHVAISAPDAVNRQGVRTGKLHIFAVPMSGKNEIMEDSDSPNVGCDG